MCPQKMGSHTLQNATALLPVNMFLCKHMKPTYQYTGLLYSQNVLQEFARSAMIFFVCTVQSHTEICSTFSAVRSFLFSVQEFYTIVTLDSHTDLASVQILLHILRYSDILDSWQTTLAMLNVLQNCVPDLYKR